MTEHSIELGVTAICQGLSYPDQVLIRKYLSNVVNKGIKIVCGTGYSSHLKLDRDTEGQRTPSLG